MSFALSWSTHSASSAGGSGRYCLRSERGADLMIVYYTTNTPPRELGIRFGVHDSVSGLAVQARRPVIVPDVSQPHYARRDERQSGCAWCCTPRTARAISGCLSARRSASMPSWPFPCGPASRSRACLTWKRPARMASTPRNARPWRTSVGSTAALCRRGVARDDEAGACARCWPSRSALPARRSVSCSRWRRTSW
jgi:hypothetical protein